MKIRATLRKDKTFPGVKSGETVEMKIDLNVNGEIYVHPKTYRSLAGFLMEWENVTLIDLKNPLEIMYNEKEK